jgi:hypothetical protein
MWFPELPSCFLLPRRRPVATAPLWKLTEFEDTLAAAGSAPSAAILLLLGLISSPANSGILALYIVLTSFAIPFFLLGSKRSPFLALAVSGLVWSLSGKLSELSAPVFMGWYLNPFAWQFVFVVGMYFGVNWDRTDSSP